MHFYDLMRSYLQHMHTCKDNKLYKTDKSTMLTSQMGVLFKKGQNVAHV